jgi:hypothetical protein
MPVPTCVRSVSRPSAARRCSTVEVPRPSPTDGGARPGPRRRSQPRRLEDATRAARRAAVHARWDVAGCRGARPRRDAFRGRRPRLRMPFSHEAGAYAEYVTPRRATFPDPRASPTSERSRCRSRADGLAGAHRGRTEFQDDVLILERRARLGTSACRSRSARAHVIATAVRPSTLSHRPGRRGVDYTTRRGSAPGRSTGDRPRADESRSTR